MKQELIRTIIEYRVEIDGLIQLTESLLPIKHDSILKVTLPEDSSQEMLTELQKSLEEWDKNPVSFGIPDNVKCDVIQLRQPQEILDTIKSLKLAKCWLGKSLGELGSESPYQNDGKRSSIEDIEPSADIFLKDLTVNGEQAIPNHYGGTGEKPIKWNETNHIEKVDWLRERVKDILKKPIKIPVNHLNLDPSNINCDRLTNSIELSCNHFSEARFHLGFELERIKNKG